jgi:hypothetical protein
MAMGETRFRFWRDRNNACDFSFEYQMKISATNIAPEAMRRICKMAQPTAYQFG